jgi:hypothetical protein
VRSFPAARVEVPWALWSPESREGMVSPRQGGRSGVNSRGSSRSPIKAGTEDLAAGLSSKMGDGGTVMMKPENLIAFDGARKLVGL